MARMSSLRRTDADKVADFMPPAMSDHPPGLCICLTDAELEKLGVNDDVEVGDMLHLRIMVEATSVHKSTNGCRIEAAIIAGSVEDETTEGDDE